MADPQWKRLDSKVLLQHPRLTVVEDTVELPNGHVTNYLRFDRTGDATEIICIRGDEILLQREYSYPTGEWLYQLPGGGIQPNETPLQACKRELREESGVVATDYQDLGQFYTLPRRASTKMHVFIANYKADTTAEGGDPEEDIKTFWIPIEEVDVMITDGKITNDTLLAAWTLFKNRK